MDYDNIFPYGRWTCENKRKVWFNRRYEPIWSKCVNGKIVKANRNEYVKNIEHKKTIYFYDDTSHPDKNIKVREKCLKILLNLINGT